MRAARIDVGGVEYLTDRDGRVHFYDVNATSNFVADAPALLGFDPTARFADSIEGVARRREGPPAGNCENVRPDPILFGWQSR
jgi:hypothetical protein